MTGLLSFITWNCLVPVQGNSFFRLYMMNDIFLNSNVKYHIVYKTTNLCNGKWYIGKHSTDNLNDGYLGSGQHLNSAIKKYGKDNFQREIICFCDSEQEAYAKEAEIVTMEVVKNPMTYNKMPGGKGGQRIYTDEEIREHVREYQRRWREVNLEHRREYNRKNQRKWRETNRERDRENKRKWREANREHEQEYQQRYQRDYYEANREQVLERKRDYYEANRDELLEYQRKWREANREKINAKQRDYYKANREKIKAKQRAKYVENKKKNFK